MLIDVAMDIDVFICPAYGLNEWTTAKLKT